MYDVDANMNSMLKKSSFLIFVSIIIIVIVHFSTKNSTEETECYTVAILDHNPFYDGANVNENIDLNFRLYHNATILAKAENVDLIVFPESGLMTGIFNRSMALEYSIEIPNDYPTILCEDISIIDDKSVSVVKRLSCLAKKYEIFLVAQLLDKQKCESECKENDGHYIFNTAIMFDRTGKLIAKYHKMQPYGEMALDPAQKEELIFVDTSIGRLGFMICFDIIYEKPGHYMAKNLDVDTIIFPTHWMDETPFLSASQIQMAWSIGNNVNVIAANIHLPSVAGSLGGGIYNGPAQTFLNVHFPDDDIERLAISRLPIHSCSNLDGCKQCSRSEDKFVEIPVDGRTITRGKYKYKQMRNDNVKMKPLEMGNFQTNLKHNGVECYLEYESKNNAILDNSKYYLIVSNRSRANPSYEWGEEFCALIFCQQMNDNEECVNYSFNDLELFSYVNLTAKFDSETIVYPSALEYQNRIISLDNNWKYSTLTDQNLIDGKKIHEIIFGSKDSNIADKKLSTLSLYGRAYNRDPPYKQVPAD